MFTVIDNFYADPDSVRDYALSKEFNVSGNYPGLRTETCTNEGGYIDNIKSTLENIIGKKITYFPLDDYNTSFQYTTKDAKTWITIRCRMQVLSTLRQMLLSIQEPQFTNIK